jgi:hypothetical protein
MDLDQKKEQYSHAYVKALAAVAGFAWSQPSVDDDSVDLGLSQKGGNGIIRSPRLDLQLKCAARAAPTEEEFGFSIKLKNYNDLRETYLMIPRILVVVFVPDQTEDWLVWSETELVLRRCAYWLNLYGLPASAYEKGQTVQMKRQQTFTAEALRGIMERIGNGGRP